MYNIVYKVMARMIFDDDYAVEEYSGICHFSREAAEKELVAAKLHCIDYDNIACLYIKEFER